MRGSNSIQDFIRSNSQMIDQNFILYAIAEKGAEKDLCDGDVERRVQLELEIKHLRGRLE